MRTRLDPSGKIYPPESVPSARERIAKLDAEIRTVRRDISERRTLQFVATPQYLEWLGGATNKLEEFRSERRQTLAWIDDQQWQVFGELLDILRGYAELGDLTQKELRLLERAEEAIRSRKAAGGGGGERGSGGPG